MAKVRPSLSTSATAFFPDASMLALVYPVAGSTMGTEMLTRSRPRVW